MTKQRLLSKTLINDLTFRVPQHTSSEVRLVIIQYHLNAKEKDWNLIMTIVKELIVYRPIIHCIISVTA